MLRRFLPLLLLALLAAVPATASATVLEPYNDAVAYDAQLTSTETGRTVSGTLAIAVRNDGRTTLSSIWLRLWGNAPKGCRPRAVEVTITAGGKRERLIRDCTALEVKLNSPLAPKQSTTIGMNLRITAPSVRDRFGTAEGINLFGNALPVVAQRDADGWRLPEGSPFGESFVSTWASFALRLTHPTALQVAAAGTTSTTPVDPVTSVTTSVVEARDTFWAIGPMEESVSSTERGTRIRVWSTPEAGGDRQDAARDAGPAIEALERRLPLYPYDELDVIVARIDAGGGMEYPTVILTDASAEVTRHEIAHQWFYALVGNDQYREPWVDEGITSFLEYSWAGSDQAAPTCYRADRLKVPSAERFITQSMRYWNRYSGRYWFVYQNPVCALREQERHLGAARFRKLIAGLVTSNAKGVLRGSEVRSAFRRAGGAKSDQIWRTWGMAPQPGG